MPHRIPAVAEKRVRNLISRLRQLVLVPDDEIRLSAQVGRSELPVPWAQRQSLSYEPISEGGTWGKTWSSAWFHLVAEVPKAWAGAQVALWLDVNGECLVCDAKGEPMLGLTKGSAFEEDYAKDIAQLVPRAQGGERIELWIEAAANGLFGVAQTDPELNRDFKPLHGEHHGSVKRMRLCRFDAEAYGLLYDLDTLSDLAAALPDGSPRKAKLWLGMDRAVTAHESAPAAGKNAAARAVLAPLFQVAADPGAIRFTGVGHAHIDTAWLWPLSETVRKTARTFASQLGMIARYPGYVFGASQAQLYAYTKEHYPSLYARVKAAVAAGSWEVQGAMWVEADCNLPSGESLVRQVVHGKRWFKQEFGVTVRNLWLPDVFGYSGQLPQILRKAGVPYFLTQKLSWNKVNTFPHNTFIWRGLDGSEVLAHFPPENDYNARCRPAALIKAQERHQERGVIDEAISLFGIGDGGGGPKEEFLERAVRMHDLNGCPPYRFGHAQPVLERMDQHRSEYDTWSGELYFELHRGTYTSQAGIKRANRRAEDALLAAELLAAVCDPTGYPRQELDAAWKKVLTNQFHDIIPGSSIHKVYEEAVPLDDAITVEARTLAKRAATHGMRADSDACTVVNPSATAFDDVIALPAGWTGASCAGKNLPTQVDGQTVLARVHVAGHGTTVLKRSSAAATAAAPRDGFELVNELVRYRFDAQARLVSAVLVADGRELVKPGATANEWLLHEDRPHAWDAWDIDPQVHDAVVDRLRIERIGHRAGPVRSEITAEGRIGASTVSLAIRLRPGSTRLDVVCDVDWQERHKLLTVRFPTTLVASEATYEVQYGHVQRPTHRNTSWDYARYEVCAHRWADLSERTRGLALLNDCKYGHSCHDGVLALSLLRAPTAPDPICDIGKHRFTYALLPHQGDLFEAPQVRAEAAMVNAGAITLGGLDGSSFKLPVQVEGEGIELAVLKAAEDDGRGLIARVVEVRGARARGRLRAPGRRIIPTDLMEWEDKPAVGDSLDLDLGAFAIETFRIV